MYHYYTCPDLGPRKAALRRLACNCEACDEKITMPWAIGLDAEDQKLFKNPVGCYFKSVLEDHNSWYIVELVEKSSIYKQDIDEERGVVLTHVTTYIAQRVQIGSVGAFAFQAKDKNENEDGYYLVEFTGLPNTDQKNNALRCD